MDIKLSHESIQNALHEIDNFEACNELVGDQKLHWFTARQLLLQAAGSMTVVEALMAMQKDDAKKS